MHEVHVCNILYATSTFSGSRKSPISSSLVFGAHNLDPVASARSPRPLLSITTAIRAPKRNPVTARGELLGVSVARSDWPRTSMKFSTPLAVLVAGATLLDTLCGLWLRVYAAEQHPSHTVTYFENLPQRLYYFDDTTVSIKFM